MRLTLRVLFLLLGWTALLPVQKVFAQVCASPGKDGPGSINANPNTYYPGTATAAVGATSISVGTVRDNTTQAIVAGDLLLVIQMQAADISATDDLAYGDGVAGGAANGYLNNANFTAGQYEYVVAGGPVAAGAIPLSAATPLVNTYRYANTVGGVGSAATGLRTFQVIRVPQYTTLTLNASISPPFWNGSTGGVTALDVLGNMNFNGNTINATGLGFRGGAGFTQTYSGANPRLQYLTTAVLGLNGMKGEGFAGTSRYVAELGGTARIDTGLDGYPGGSASRGAPGNAGGGGNDNGNNSGGSGGSNGAAGGRGGNSSDVPTNPAVIGGEASAAFAQVSSSRLVLGGGGGAGSTNDGSSSTTNTGSGFASSGAPGGGIVIVRTGTVSGTGSISANGASAAGVRNDGGGGGGAGGSILLTAFTSQAGLANLNLSATGGNGGIARPVDNTAANANAHGPGGGGGGGVILTTGTTATAATAGGANGTSTPGTTVGSATGNYGAVAGTASTGTAKNASISNTIANSTSGASCSTQLTGYVYEDANYGGGAGRSRATLGTGAVGRPGAIVELYDAAGTFLLSAVTDANGMYTISAITSRNYTVRVVNSSVISNRTGATFTGNATAGYTSTQVAVQTYGGSTQVGGQAPAKTDAAAGTTGTTLASLNTNTTIAQSQVTLTTATSGNTTGPDFGYNFDLVVNTNDAGQGSLRQFITNANALGGEANLAQAGSYTDIVNLATGSTAAGLAPVALPAGVETSIFMIPANLLTGGVAVITPATALPQVTGVNTAINGSTQTFNIGNSNDVLLGAGGTVGTAATALSRLNGPEVQLVGSTAVATGLNIAGAGSRVRGLAIYGFGNNVDSDANGNIVTSASNLIIAGNAIGSTATSFAVPAVANVSADVRVASGTGLSFTNNLVGFAGGTGIYLAPGVTGTTLTSNEIRGNGRINTIFDGIDSHGSSTTATGNLFADGGGQGFDSFSSTGSNNVTGNTFTNNGIGSATTPPYETAAARFYGTGNTFSQNVSTGNYGAGVEVVNGSTTVISRNAIYNNGNVTSVNGTAASGQIGIDLLANGGNENTGNTPYVTLNSATTTGGNNLLNYPVLRTATIVGTNLVLTGYAKPGAIIELFTAQANPAGINATGANFGQGRTYLTTLTEGGTTNGVTDTDPSTGQSYSGNVNGFNQGSDTNANGFTFSIPLASLPGGALPAGTVLTSTATLTGATSEFSGNVTAVSPLTGFVYEDVNYGGGAGRSRATLGAAAIGRPGAKVELYDGTGALVGTAITDANGQYTFNAPVGTGYTVRVVNNSVLSSRTGATAASGSATTGYVSNQLAVQTYNGTTTRVGGEKPGLADAAANTGTQALSALTSGTNVPESIATVNVGTGATNAGPDFGFNFDLVVNTSNAGQGSLAQFITNANALGGEGALAQSGSNTAGALPAGRETSIFMIPSGAAVPGQLAGLPNGLNASGVAAINLTAALPAIAGSNTAIDGTTQTFNIGNTNNVALGAGGTVGTGGTALGQLNGPEVQLRGATTFDGVTIATNTNNTTVRGLSIYGFGTGILGGVNDTGTRIEQNVIGASATSFADPGAGNRNLNEGINLNDSDNGFVANNLIGFNGGMGVWVLTGNVNGSNGANGNAITGNEIRGNALTTISGNGERLVYDGLELQGSSTGNTVTGNLITANVGHGIDSFGNDIGGNTVSGNTISNNGVGVANNTGEEGSGLRIFGTTNPTIVSSNVLTGNNGSGVLVIGGASQVTISQNSTSGNTRLGIDLLSAAESTYGTAPGTVYWNGQLNGNPNATLNDNGDSDSGGNGLLNYPVLTTATLNATTLVVSGYARPGSLVELFLAAPLGTDPTATNKYFGQGSGFLTSRTEGLAADDSNPGTGTYGPGLINGVAQGTDNTNQFTFSILLSSLTAAQRTALLNNTALLTSTATLARSTSEFSANTRVLQAPVPNNATNGSVAGNQTTPAVLNPNLSATASGFTSDITTSTTNTIASYVVNPIATAQGTLFYNGTAVTAATPVPAANLGQLTFVPARNFSGNATFTYTATDANGIVSTTNSAGGTVTDGPATYTIPVAVPLPVVLVEFTTQAVANRNALLSWSTASEKNNDYFEVERSFDGTSFTALAKVAGHGTTASASAYTFTDAGVASRATGLVYYRLRQVDLGGTSTYSPQRTVSFTKALLAKLTLFPNPVAERTSLDLGALPTTGTFQAQLLDATGRQVRTWTLAGGIAHPLEMTELASGSYLLVVTGQQPDGSLLKQTLRLTKE